MQMANHRLGARSPLALSTQCRRMFPVLTSSATATSNTGHCRGNQHVAVLYTVRSNQPTGLPYTPCTSLIIPSCLLCTSTYLLCGGNTLHQLHGWRPRQNAAHDHLPRYNTCLGTQVSARTRPERVRAGAFHGLPYTTGGAKIIGSPCG